MKNKRPTKRIVGLSLVLVAGVLLVACGGQPAAPEATPINEVAQAVPTVTEPTAVSAPTDTAPPPTLVEIPQATDTAPAPTEPPALPADTPASPVDTPEPLPTVVSTFGQTEDGLYFRGNPAAAVTVIDYSDFL